MRSKSDLFCALRTALNLHKGLSLKTTIAFIDILS